MKRPRCYVGVGGAGEERMGEAGAAPGLSRRKMTVA